MPNVIVTTKKDIIWNYIAIFFNMGAGIIVLPLILHFLSAEEIGLNYLMLTISSMVALIDFGFSPQIGRNVTYAISGAKRVEREGLHDEVNPEPNYRLLASVIEAAKYIYRRLSVVVVVLMLTLGTYYIYYVTHGFKDVSNSLSIWIVFCISNYFNIYFIYYRSLLTGSGKIYESSVSIILSKLTYIIVCGILILFNFGLLSVVVANMLSPLVLFAYSHYKFYNKELSDLLSVEITKEEINEVLSGIWYNAKKLGINSLGSFAILKLNLFLIGMFLPLSIVGSFGILTQIIPTLSAVATALFNSYLPQIASLQIAHNHEEITKKLSVTVAIYWLIMIVGGCTLIILLPWILRIIGSNTVEPPMLISFLYLIVITLEGNHSNFATIIVTSNKVPFVVAGLVAGGLIAFFTYISLRFTNLGLLGVVLVQGVVQLAYNNWKWPLYVLKSLDCSPSVFVFTGIKGITSLIRKEVVNGRFI